MATFYVYCRLPHIGVLRFTQLAPSAKYAEDSYRMMGHDVTKVREVRRG